MDRYNEVLARIMGWLQWPKNATKRKYSALYSTRLVKSNTLGPGLTGTTIMIGMG
jgi:hypothetical protein